MKMASAPLLLVACRWHVATNLGLLYAYLWLPSMRNLGILRPACCCTCGATAWADVVSSALATLSNGVEVLASTVPLLVGSILSAAANITAFWQHLHKAELKTQTVKLQLESMAAPAGRPGATGSMPSTSDRPSAEELDEEPVEVEVRTLNLTDNTAFMGMDGALSSILVLPQYEELWKEVEPLIELGRTSTAPFAESTPARFVYTGTPGIGKSVGAWVFLYKLREKYGSKIDIVYQHQRRGQQYLFCGSGEVWSSRTKHGSFDDILLKPTTVLMVDGKGVEEWDGPATFVFCSPNMNNWKEFEKASKVQVRYLPIWSWMQLLVARQLFYPQVRQERLAELYAKWGGVPRAVLEKADNDSYQRKTMDEALVRARSLSEILSTVGEVAASDEISNKILHYVVDSDYIGTQVVFASQWVAEEIIRRGGQQAEHEIRKFLAAQEANPQAAGLRGQVFEALAHKVLQRGGNFRVKPLGDNSQSATNSTVSEHWPARIYKQFSKVTELRGLACAGDLYLVPAAKNNKAFDAVRPPQDALQMTVSPRHPINHAGKPLVSRLVYLTPSWQRSLPHIYCAWPAMYQIQVAYSPHVMLCAPYWSK